jgi:hypothetical protein
MPVVGTLQFTPPPPPSSVTLPLMVLACTITPNEFHAVGPAKTWLLPVRVPPVPALGSSEHGEKLGSQPCRGRHRSPQ